MFVDRDEIVAQTPARPPDTAIAKSDRTTSGARESGPFDSEARRASTMMADAVRSPERRPATERARVLAGQLNGARLQAPQSLFGWLPLAPRQFFANFDALARRHPEIFRGGEDVRAHVLDVLDNADVALEQTARKTIALVHRTNRGLLIFEAVPRGGRYFIMRAYRLAASRFESMLARAERLGGTTYVRPSVQSQTATPARELDTQDNGSGGEAQQSRAPLAGETARVTPTNEGPPDVSATRSKSNPDNDGLTRVAEEERAALESVVLRAIEQVAGPEAAQRTATPDRIGERPGRDWNLGHDQGQYESAGAYYPGRERSGVLPLIAVALADNPDAVRTAYSEGWHAIEGTLTKTEIAILRRETPRLRKNVIAQSPDLAGVAGKAEPEEIWAEAAANHAIGQANGESGRGIHIAVRRIFAKITRPRITVTVH